MCVNIGRTYIVILYLMYCLFCSIFDYDEIDAAAAASADGDVDVDGNVGYAHHRHHKRHTPFRCVCNCSWPKRET